MTGFIATVATCTALGGLLLGVVAHLTRPRMLAQALRRHNVLPTSIVGGAAVVVTVIETGLATTGVIAFVIGAAAPLTAVLWTTAGLFTAYAAYARYVTATRRGGPCGCSRAEVPMDDWVAVRAVGFTVCAGGGALLAGATPANTTEWTIAALATATLTLALWQLPAAMRQPASGGAAAWTS